ncbi:glycosyltransferase family 4 protein [Novosphingobium sp. 1949]|uniref:Glycosyltransferase family 4 protein n=1 Tax=Novosphingobium organovorum TaxID=2930092 RepID=A0ABT0BGL9_9SPHN|nr:glycosyltransferase family 4 protein [Novosphingobium organovorum]MCJ2184181.1 glycosyltransferase family 4 protein [Novosphingobium organovorum]
MIEPSAQPVRRVLLAASNWGANDGVGNDVHGMVKALQRRGIEVGVYVAHHCDPVFAPWRCDEAQARLWAQDAATALIYHHSLGCVLSQALFMEARCPVRVLRYHNITPSHLISAYDRALADLCDEGRMALAALVPHASGFLVPSLFNAGELLRHGARARDVAHQPCFHRLADFDLYPVDAEVSRALIADPRLKVVSIGRRSPHKGHRHLIEAVAAYRARFDREIVLHIIGGGGFPAYDAELEAQVAALDLGGQVTIHAKLGFEAMLAYYRHGDVYACLSEHEGFCLPVIEAQFAGLPVVAYCEGGVPEALGPAQPHGLAQLDPDACAEALHALRRDPERARAIGAAGRAWVEERYAPIDLEAQFLAWLDTAFEAEGTGAGGAAGRQPMPVAQGVAGDDFDADWYRARYPDVARLAMDARTHYAWLGRRLGRLPKPPGPTA